jgi:hypothetical protein
VTLQSSAGLQFQQALITTKNTFRIGSSQFALGKNDTAISGQALRVCPEGKPFPLFRARSTRRYSSRAFPHDIVAVFFGDHADAVTIVLAPASCRVQNFSAAYERQDA